jgi:hypothetical protein
MQAIEQKIEHLFALREGTSLDYFRERYVYSSGIPEFDNFLSPLGGIPAGGILGIKCDDDTGMLLASLLMKGRSGSIYSNKIRDRLGFLNSHGLSSIDIIPSMEGESQKAIWGHISDNKCPYVVIEDPIDLRKKQILPGIEKLVAYYRRFALTINPLYIYLSSEGAKVLPIGVVLKVVPLDKKKRHYLMKCLKNPYRPAPVVLPYYGPDYPEIKCRVEVVSGLTKALFGNSTKPFFPPSARF